MTKSEITKALKPLTKYGWDVKTFNHNKAMPTGARDWVDHFLVHESKGWIIFIEVKIGKDSLSEGQTEYKKSLQSCCNANGKAQYILFPGKYKTIPELLDYLFNC